MPDLERLMRDLAIHTAPDEQTRRELRAYYRGLDKARRQIAVAAAIVALAVLLVAWSAA